MKYSGWIKTRYDYKVEADSEEDAKEQIAEMIRENMTSDEIEVDEDNEVE